MSTQKIEHNDNSFGAALKKVRKARKVTLEELGALLKISYGYIGQIERGTRVPNDLVKATLENWMSSEGHDVAEFKATIDQPQTISEQLGPGYSPEVKAMAEYLEVKIGGKTREERLAIIEDMMADLRAKYK